MFILLLPLLKLPENWKWVTQKGVGILFIVTLSFLIVHGVTAMQAALLSQQQLDCRIISLRGGFTLRFR
jgi:putative effector of murein hydrolase LrgA (UPF0299 family)